MQSKEKLLEKDMFSKVDIIQLLESKDAERTLLFQKAAEIKEKHLGNIVYYRGLIEFSNNCSKDCLYCGIRKSNQNVMRYNVSDEEILAAAKFAFEQNYGSVVLQSGELEATKNTERINRLVREIKKLSNNELGITLSCGEQEPDVYKQWLDAGAHRYLLRIESSNEALYKKIHPANKNHSFDKRMSCLQSLKNLGYQTGTGVMVGLPFQSMDDLANDLLFMQDFDIDMVGMGPYIEHSDTPLFEERNSLLPLQERFDLTLKMIAVLRVMMKDINMAASTAMQAIDKLGREKAIKVGANIVMPNITPGMYRDSYKLYENKPCTDENAEDCKTCLEARVNLTNHTIGYGEWGDSKHFKARTKIVEQD
jgi:biotin synthase